MCSSPICHAERPCCLNDQHNIPLLRNSVEIEKIQFISFTFPLLVVTGDKVKNSLVDFLMNDNFPTGISWDVYQKD